MLTSWVYWDQDLLVWLNNLGKEPYDVFWVFATQIESWIPLFIYFCIIVLYYHKGKKGLAMLLGAIVTFLVTLALTDLTKIYVARIRPNNITELSGLIRVLQDPATYSFFSGHASSSFCIVTFLVLAIRRFNSWIYLAYAWPIIFVVSRIYVGVHFPSDILSGAVVGIILAVQGFRITRYSRRNI